MTLIDTHAHIHFDEFRDDLETVFTNAKKVGLESIITVGCSADDSLSAIGFVLDPDVQAISGDIKLFTTVGIHPHEASGGEKEFARIKEMMGNADYDKSIVAIGECGLDYFKNHSSKEEQYAMLEWHLQLANELGLPLVFHVRDAWDDFFKILQKYPKMRGVIHSFTGHVEHVDLASKYDLYFGLNGIMTFTKDEPQLEAAKTIPSDKLLLETDCPYLAPAPYRGKRNEPSYIIATAQFLADLRDKKYSELVSQSGKNAKELFAL